jgi:nucleoside-triphosphatase THEP1
MSLYLLTAPSGAGKTTFCAALAEQARAAGWDVAGVLSPPIFENGQKVGILVQNLRTGETRPLAIAYHLSLSTLHLSLSTLPLSTYHLPLGNWLFSPSALAWGNDLLASCLPTDLFIVDELGPLELIRGEGWVNALEALRSGRYKTGLVVIRPELVEKARQQLPINEVISLAK